MELLSSNLLKINYMKLKLIKKPIEYNNQKRNPQKIQKIYEYIWIKII